MCGIVGVMTRSTPVDASGLMKMAEKLDHRGPDDEGVYTKGTVGLASKRLSIIDLEGGHQPMSNEDGSVWIVFNGEIYNYLEIRRDLTALGHRMKTNSDTEVIVHLYEEYGEGCVERLNGMFAFAIWDDPRQRLFIARDRLGIKPFYYHWGADAFAFASEIKALIKWPDVPVAPDYEAINEYVTFQFCMGDRTLFKDVKRLLPGYYMIAYRTDTESLDVKMHQYWDLDYNIDSCHSEAYFAEKLLMLIEDSIRLRLRSDVPLGAHLSGGIDSSSVVSIASSLLSDTTLRTFTGGFREPGYDETDYAKLVSQAAGTEYFEVFPTPDDFVETMPMLIYYLDEPVAGPGAFAQLFVSRLASEHVKVVLGGQGGDEAFGGYIRYLVAYLEQCIKGAIYGTQEEGEYVVTFESIRPHLHQLQRYEPLLKEFWRDGLFNSMERRYYTLVNRCRWVERLYSDELLNNRDDEGIYEGFRQLFDKPNTSSYFNKMTYFDTKTLLPALLHVEDRTSMAASVESRVPLLDHRILELQATIPPTMRFAGGEAKHILKLAVRNVVPQEVLKRKHKMGFPVPLSQWALGPIRGFLQEVLLSKRARGRGIYNVDGVADLIKTEGEFDRRLWGVLCLELWFRAFIDG